MQIACILIEDYKFVFLVRGKLNLQILFTLLMHKTIAFCNCANYQQLVRSHKKIQTERESDRKRERDRQRQREKERERVKTWEMLVHNYELVIAH